MTGNSRGLLILILAGSCTASLDGTAIIKRDGHLDLVNVASGAVKTIDVGIDYGTGGPCFSPDGRQIAYRQWANNQSVIRMIYNDGTHITDVPFNTDANTAVNWCTDGCLYFSGNMDRNIYRLTIATQKIVSVFVSSHGEGPNEVEMSLDGTRAAATYYRINGENQVHYFDIARQLDVNMGNGCQGALSPSGNLVLLDGSGNVDGRGDHQWAQILRSSDKTRFCPIIHPPVGMGWGSFRFSVATDTFFVFTSEQTSQLDGYVFDLRNCSSTHIGKGRAYDFWPGALPPPPGNVPVIAASPLSLSFVAMGTTQPPAQSVTVTNTGSATLGRVTATSSAAWLAVTVQQPIGTSQQLTNTVSAAGLANGAYQATVVVNGGGASNSVTYTVTLNVGSSIPAPSGFTGSVISETSVSLKWHDNALDETGYGVERAYAGGTWAEIRRLPPNDSVYVDSGLTSDTTYRYRVRAVRNNEFSGYTPVCTLKLSSKGTITITSPLPGTALKTGTTCQIRWTTTKVSDVYLSYSIDGGMGWILIDQEGSVKSSNPQWGNYAWKVPALAAESIWVQVKEYTGSVVVDAGPMRIDKTGIKCAPVNGTAHARKSVTRISLNNAFPRQFLNSGTGQRIYRLDGKEHGASIGKASDDTRKTAGMYLLK